MTEKGFTLISLLLVLMIISSCLLLTLQNYHEIEDEHLYFMNDYLECQTDALCEREEKDLSKNNIRFYKTGRVNQAKTIEFKKHKVIVHLGNGHLTYE